MKAAKAEGGLIVDPGEDTFPAIRAVFTAKAGRLERNPIPREQGIELVEGKTRRACGANEEEVALGETGLNGRDVDGLKQLGLKQFTDSGDLVARQSGICIGKQSVSGKVSWISVDGLPSFYQAKLLEAQIVVDLAKGCAARSQI